MHQRYNYEQGKMIPKDQLVKLKPLHDQLKRERMVKSKRTRPIRKGRLTKRARQYALYPPQPKGIKEPSGIRWKGNPPMSERKKK
jgi:hypothetical protein